MKIHEIFKSESKIISLKEFKLLVKNCQDNNIEIFCNSLILDIEDANLDKCYIPISVYPVERGELSKAIYNIEWFKLNIILTQSDIADLFNSIYNNKDMDITIKSYLHGESYIYFNKVNSVEYFDSIIKIAYLNYNKEL